MSATKRVSKSDSHNVRKKRIRSAVSGPIFQFMKKLFEIKKVLFDLLQNIIM